MRKKIISFLGMLVLAASLTGCGDKPDTQATSAVTTQESVSGASDEMDFTEYENGNKDIAEVVDSQPGFGTMKVIVVEKDNDADTRKVVAILSDLDSFTEKEELNYYYYIYAPKDVTEVKTRGRENFTSYVNPDLDKSYYSSIKASMTLQIGAAGKDMACGAEVTYDDGTKDAIKIYVTK